MIPNNILKILGKFNPNVQAMQNIKTPDELAQYLLNSGKVNQQQVNQAKQMWKNADVQNRINNMMFRL